MQKKAIVIFGMVVMTMFLIMGCEGERGLQGDPGTTTCFGCHDNDNLEMIAIERQWQNSNHGIGATVFESGQSCSRCHTGQGFISVHTGEGDTIAVDENPAVIHCFVCHAPHSDGNFNLRVTGAIDYPMGGTFDGFGYASTCAACHQARRPNPMYSDADSLKIGSARWGPHHSMQSDVFFGTHAYVFPGEDYDTTSSHNQNIQNACIGCHMAASFGDIAGGHSMNLTYIDEGEEGELTAGCTVTGCHDGEDDFTFDYNGVQDSVEALLETLRGLLLEDSLITEDNLVNAGRTDTLAVPMDVAGAIFNFLFFEGDRSLGVHNPDYYFSALNASIDFMNSRRILAAH
jgi:hypothetical protein